MVANPSFDLFQLSDEHKELRTVLRDLCEKEIAPYAAEVDAQARYTDEALAALDCLGLLRGAHPRGVRRAGRGLGRGVHRHRGGRAGMCVVLAHPGLQQARHDGVVAARLRRAQDSRCCPRSRPVRRWRPMRSPSARPAATPRRCAPGRVADGDDWILNGTKCWISNGGKSTWYTVMAVTDPDKGANGISAFIVHKDDEGFSVGPKERKLGIKGSPDHRAVLRELPHPG